MDEKRLNRLKNIEVPEPTAAAKRLAVESAVSAFEDAQKKNACTPQGFFSGLRLTPIFTPIWEFMMTKRVIAGAVASTVLLVPVAGLYFKDQGGFKPRTLGLDNKPQILQPENQKARKELAKPDQDARSEFKTAQEQRQDQNLNDVVSGEREIAAKASGRARIVNAPPPKAQEAPAQQPSSKDQSALAPAPAAEPAPLNKLGKIKRFSSQSGAQKFAPRTEMNRAMRRQVLPRKERFAVMPQPDRDKFTSFESNSTKLVGEQPVSTFSIDVDTASYAFVRRLLKRGALPQKNAVRVEEMINYFPYAYPAPESAEVPFKPSMTLYPTPWNAETKLLHIGIKGLKVDVANMKPKNLVFLIDVSGSMNSADKLPLLKSAFRLLVNELKADDTVSIVTYAGRAGTVLEPTKAKDKHKILAAIDHLRPGGSTAGAAGIQQAYALAQSVRVKEGVNRVILATDGDFNVGISSTAKLKDYIETKRKTGISLSVLGFGQGNLNDALMQTLAQNGNGNAAYIDSLSEARKVLVEEVGSTLVTIAKDVKIQIEFNPQVVSEYRLIGYETRNLRRQDFNNDKIDAGEIGSGHTVTAIYEITPKGAKQTVDGLRYKPAEPKKAVGVAPHGNEYGFLKMRYKLPKQDKSKLISVPIIRDLEKSTLADVSDEVKFATSVAAFGQKLRKESRIADYAYEDILKMATAARGADTFGYRSEFLSLVRLAKSLSGESRQPAKQDR